MKDSGGAWKRMVQEAMPPPAWLSADAPQNDVVLSSRVRIMRNLRGFKFPHHLERSELERVQSLILGTLKGTDLEIMRQLAPGERHYLVGCRLISVEFAFESPGRSLVLNSERSASVMVNEEDHLRIQALSAGWSPDTAHVMAESILERAKGLDFAWSPRFGYLAASPYNAGDGRRISAMFNLIGLAHLRRLPNVLKALSLRKIASRGLFGESSRAIGAYVQVSITEGRLADFIGACEYLMTEERAARREVGRDFLSERVENVRDFVLGSPVLSLADAFRALGWLRWAAVAGLDIARWTAREADGWLTHLELQGDSEDQILMRHRADFLREKIS